MYYLETVTAIGLKVGLSIQINKKMKSNENQRSRSLFDSDLKSKTCFSQKPLLTSFGTKSHIKAYG